MGKKLGYLFILFILLALCLEMYLRLFGNYCEPWFDKEEKIVKRRPNTEGVYKTEFTNSGYYHINNEGWNSHRNYYPRIENDKGLPKKSKREAEDANQNSSTLRIAIVGHSNIEGLRVPVDKTLSKILEDDLNKKAIHAEVYTFGFGGMDLAQALHVSRYVMRRFHPDILLIGTQLDDFWEASTKKKNFLKLTMDTIGNIQEVLPQKYECDEDSPFSLLYFSKWVYFLERRIGLGERGFHFLKAKKLSVGDTKEQKGISESEWDSAYRYIIQEFKKVASQNGDQEVPYFFLKFSPYIPSFNYDYTRIQSNDKESKCRFEESLCRNEIQVIDLDDAFKADYKIHGENYDFINDFHYNENAHQVIGLYLSDITRTLLTKNKR